MGCYWGVARALQYAKALPPHQKEKGAITAPLESVIRWVEDHRTQAKPFLPFARYMPNQH